MPLLIETKYIPYFPFDRIIVLLLNSYNLLVRRNPAILLDKPDEE